MNIRVVILFISFLVAQNSVSQDLKANNTVQNKTLFSAKSKSSSSIKDIYLPIIPKKLQAQNYKIQDQVGWINIGGSSSNPATRFISGFDLNYDYIGNNTSFWQQVIESKLIPLNNLFSTVHLHNPFGLPSDIGNNGVHMEFAQALNAGTLFNQQLNFGFVDSFNRYLKQDRNRKITFYVGGPHFWQELVNNYQGGKLTDSVNLNAKLLVDNAMTLFVQLAKNNPSQVSLGMDNTGSRLENTISHAVYDYLKNVGGFRYIFVEATPKLSSFSFTAYDGEVSFLGLLRTVYKNHNPAQRAAVIGVYPYHSYFIGEASNINVINQEKESAPILIARSPEDYNLDSTLFKQAAIEGYRFAFGIMTLKELLGVNWFGDLNKAHAVILENFLYGTGNSIAFRIPRPSTQDWDNNSIVPVVECPNQDILVDKFPIEGADPFAMLGIRSGAIKDYSCKYYYLSDDGKQSVRASLDLKFN